MLWIFLGWPLKGKRNVVGSPKCPYFEHFTSKVSVQRTCMQSRWNKQVLHTIHTLIWLITQSLIHQDSMMSPKSVCIGGYISAPRLSIYCTLYIHIAANYHLNYPGPAPSGLIAQLIEQWWSNMEVTGLNSTNVITLCGRHLMLSRKLMGSLQHFKLLLHN